MIDAAGTITRVDRTANTAYARFAGSGSGEETLHAYIDEPIPLAPAAFTRVNGQLVCLATMGRPERINRDHFLYGAGAPWEGDEPWTSSGIGTLTHVVGIDALGAVRITQTGAGNMLITKNDRGLVLPSDGFLHIRARMQSDAAGTIANPDVAWVGVRENTTSYIARIAIFGNATDGPYWVIQTFDSGGASYLQVEGTAFVTSTWYWVDLMVNTELAAASVDGGPVSISEFSGTGVSVAVDCGIGTLSPPNYTELDQLTVDYVPVIDVEAGRTDT